MFDGGVTTSTLQERFNGETIMKKIRNILAMALAVVMSLSIMVPAFAAEAEPDEATQEAATVVEVTDDGSGNNGDEGIMPLSTDYIWVGNSYRQIAYNPNGINGNLHIWVTHTLSTPNQLGYNGWNRGMDVLMYDRNGNVVWRGDNVFGVSSSGKLWCGADVVRVDMRIAAKIGVNEDWYEVEVTY